MLNRVAIVAAKRTPMGAFQGALASLTAPQLASMQAPPPPPTCNTPRCHLLGFFLVEWKLLSQMTE